MAETTVNPEAGAEAAAQNPAANQEEQNTEEKNESKTYTQDEVAKMLQAESDRRVQQALKTFKEKDLPGLLQQAQTEAEKLAKMTAEQKAQHEREQREKDLQERETTLTRKELRAAARDTLAGKGLPGELAELLPCSDAESCKKGLEVLESAFGKAVTAAVNDRLRQSPPKAGTPNKGTVSKDAFAVMGYRERLALKKEQPEIYEQLKEK